MIVYDAGSKPFSSSVCARDIVVASKLKKGKLTFNLPGELLTIAVPERS
jgi:hypothetical protein